MKSLLFRRVEVDGAVQDVRVVAGVVTEVAPHLQRGPAHEAVVLGHGRALLPGLHDHHVHLLALAATLDSVDVGPTRVDGLRDLAAALRTGVGPDGWVRATGYHETVAGPLDRHVLDRAVAEVPVRVQHRSGALWILNTVALDRVRHALDDSEDVERDPSGIPNGRLWRYDDRLRPILPSRPPELSRVGGLLTSYGITGVTDATPDLAPGTIDLLAAAVASGDLPPVHLLGCPDTGELPAGLTRGPRKLLLRDHDLPSYDALLAAVRGIRSRDRAVAVHCVTRESLLLTLAVLDEVRPLPGDRIEHASVVPTEVLETMRDLGVTVVTQPGFVTQRGDTYLREVAPHDRDCLYRWRSLRDAGVPTVASSDAPFGDLDPWAVIRSAVERRTHSDAVLGTDERATDPVQVLEGYLTAPTRPGGPPRRVQPGAPADLVLLSAGLRESLEATEPPVHWVTRAAAPNENLP